jgi:UPF0042 nucleotide-binding protein
MDDSQQNLPPDPPENHSQGHPPGPAAAAAPEASEQRLRILIISGISGAGKTTALRALEDIGYYCVDNLPLPLLGQFVSLVSQSRQHEKAALVIDAREGKFLIGFREAMAELRRAGHALEVLFLDAADDVLVRRFSETRRRHPMGSRPGRAEADDLRAGIQHERHELMPLRDEAHAVVDTGGLNVHQLKGVIQERYGRSEQKLAVTFLSFGYKHGLPVEADIVLDVRFLPNPYFVEHLSAQTGLQEPVARFVLEHPDTQEFLGTVEELLAFYLPRAELEGKSYLTIAIGCTGGRHRSVALAAELFNRLRNRYQITVRHRELGRGP